jgi:hypothetical protein
MAFSDFQMFSTTVEKKLMIMETVKGIIRTRADTGAGI